MGDHTTTSNGGLDQGVEFFVATDCQLQVAGGDALDLQVFACIASELENLSREVLKDRGGVNSGSRTDTAVRANSAFQESMNSSDRELCTVLFLICCFCLYLPRVQRELISTWGSSWTCHCQTCLLFLLFLFQPKILTLMVIKLNHFSVGNCETEI